MTYFLHQYMEPATVSDFPGYRVRKQYAHLLPPMQGRPENYCLTPYCLPDYNQVCIKALAELDQSGAREYAGSFNSTLY